MTVSKIDTSVFMLPSSRASQSGVGTSRAVMVANKVNDIIDELGSMATASTIAAVNLQVASFSQALDTINQQVANYNNTMSQALSALSQRVSALEFPSADAITDVSTTGVNVSILNLLALQALNSQATSQGQAINKILAVMRTRKEIRT